MHCDSFLPFGSLSLENKSGFNFKANEFSRLVYFLLFVFVLPLGEGLLLSKLVPFILVLVQKLCQHKFFMK